MRKTPNQKHPKNNAPSQWRLPLVSPVRLEHVQYLSRCQHGVCPGLPASLRSSLKPPSHSSRLCAQVFHSPGDLAWGWPRPLHSSFCAAPFQHSGPGPQASALPSWLDSLARPLPGSTLAKGIRTSWVRVPARGRGAGKSRQQEATPPASSQVSAPLRLCSPKNLGKVLCRLSCFICKVGH